MHDSEEEAIGALKNGEVSAVSLISGYNISSIDNIHNVRINEFILPRYIAIFFNQTKSEILAEKTVRQALSYATNRQEIMEVASGNKGIPIYGPIVPELLGYNPKLEQDNEFSLEKAKEILENNNWKDNDLDGVREKTFRGGEEPVALEINIVTVQWPELEKTIRVIKEQWEAAGFRININSYTLGEIQQDFIRPREYEALLFGQAIGIDPDPFSFWHSSQKKDPGLNLSLYENKRVDKLLEDARQELISDTRALNYVEFQEEVSSDIPAIFLYSPAYLYPVNENTKGIGSGKIADPSRRFSDITEWYIQTKRVWR